MSDSSTKHTSRSQFGAGSSAVLNEKAAFTAKAEDLFKVKCHEWLHADGTLCLDHECSQPWRDAVLAQGCDPFEPQARMAVLDQVIGTARWHEPRLRWEDTIENLVVTAGLNHLMSRTMRATGVGGASAGYNDGRRLPTKWLVGTAYSIGDIVRPSGGSAQDANNRFFICQVAGTSHASTEPTWPNTVATTVTDNTVTWAEASTLYVGLVGAGGGNTYALADTMASHAGWTEQVPYSNGTRPGYTPGAVAAGSCDDSAAKAIFNINATATVGGCFLCDIQTKSGSAGMLYGVGSFTGGDRAVQSGDTLNVTVTTSVS